MKSLVLLSGGIDSSTCLALCVKEIGKENVTALCVSYGQKHVKETKAAAAVAEHYGVRLINLDLSAMFEYSDCSLLTNSSVDIPKGEYKHMNADDVHAEPPSTYVPFRNGLFISAAASIALSLGCSTVYYGAHSDDAAHVYPDCSAEFNHAISLAVFEGSGRKVKIEAPFIGLAKAEIVEIGLGLKVPYNLTWSCYEGGDEPCGVCGTCLDREKAFKLNGAAEN